MKSACPFARAALACAFPLLLLAPSRAHAVQGLALAWNHCHGDAGWAQNADFACNTNVGTHVMVGLFQLASPMETVIGEEIVLDLATASPSLPPWWQLKNTGFCRQLSLSATFIPDPADVGCPDWSAGLSVGGIGGYCTAFNAMPGGCGIPSQPANTARIKLIAAVAGANAQDLLGGQNYFAFSLSINHAKTIGTGSCDGCATPVCIVLNSIMVAAPGAFIGDTFVSDQRFITATTAPGSNFITWQGGGGVVGGGGIGCPAATPTRQSTWGNVKSLYR